MEDLLSLLASRTDPILHPEVIQRIGPTEHRD